MKKHFYHRGNGAKNETGFTLVEILVAEAIFLILLVVVMQLIFGVLETAASQKKRMDSLEDARQSLDRLSQDWTARVRRGDINGLFTPNAGNDQISFPTQVQAYSGTRHLAWVTYGVNDVKQVNQGSQNTLTPALVRSITGYNWLSSEGANPWMVFPVSTPSATTTVPDPLANTIFRFEYCFLQQVPTIPTATTTSAFTVNSALTLNSPSLVGIVVAVAALDQQSRQILTPAQLTSLTGALADVVDGQNPQSIWLSAINGNGFAAKAGVPQSVAGAVRVYQRILYVKE